MLGLKLKGLIVNGKVIFAVFIAVLIGVGFYFGYLRHEPRCYEAIDKKITSTQASLEEWSSTPPDSMTKRDVYGFAFCKFEQTLGQLIALWV